MATHKSAKKLKKRLTATVDLLIDQKKAGQLNCKECPAALQSLRNCSGSGSPAMVDLNNRMYKRCPRAIYLESFDARYFVSLYLECRKTSTYPAPGGPTQQTHFTTELFEFLDELTRHVKSSEDK